MVFFRRTISPDEVALAVKNAVADATNASTLAMHMAQCEQDKAETKAEQLRMHGENLQRHDSSEAKNDRRFDELERQNRTIMRLVWGASGAIIAFHFIASAEGASIFSRLFHG